jgi:hypothetical protein
MLVLFVSLMHILWGILLFANGGALHIAATSTLLQVVGEGHYWLRASAYIIAGLMPSVLLWRPGSVVGLASVLPQQILIIMSGISAVVAITTGHYADGVIRPPLFIAMDQGIYIIAALLHALETVDRFAERGSDGHGQ